SWDQNYSHTYFGNCNNIIGDQGTTFRNASYQYARVDGGESAPGYFTTGNYKIFYELDGGTNDVNNPIDFDIHLASDITIKQPTKDGYDFIGWTGTLASGLSETVPETDVKIAAGSIGNRIYTAHWAKKPKLTFDTKGGSQVHVPIVASAGSDISSEVTPIINGTNVTTKNGYDFVKWDKVIPTTMPATDLTITALWTPTVYNINLNYDGGELPTGKSNPTTFTIETETFTLEKPEKTGYTFAGWHTGKTVDPDGTITKGYYAQDLDYTATWNVNQYTITFNTDGGSAVAAITQDYNSAITAPANPTKEHYKFIGWDKAIPATMPAENITLTAQWEAIEYNITLDYAGGELPSGKSNPTTYTIETPTFTLEKPVKTGYTFAGWNTGKAVDPDGTIVKGSFDDIALTATWQINQYTITFNTDGGSEISAIKQDFNTAITKPADPVKTGYTFLDWDKDIPNTMPAEDVTITAKWQINTHTITFDTDGGTPIDKMTVKYGENITKPTDPVKTGSTFLGWDKQIPETMPDEDLTFKAQWQINQCTITFDTDGADPIETITQYYNTAITAPANPAKKGFTFLGWQPALPATMPANNLTVKAQWRDDRETIAVDFNGTTSFPTDADKFCNGNETSISLPFTITKGQPSEYIVTFENGTVVNGKVDANNNVLIEIPNDLESGVYKGSVVFN
ncbi:MAG: InlB B-repeat-containing protein, partial [Bacteroidales bacterium]|nr:InlB B-repeat-containing protein [Bacteroidales bacterium]